MSKARANERQKKYPPHSLPGFTRSRGSNEPPLRFNDGRLETLKVCFPYIVLPAKYTKCFTKLDMCCKVFRSKRLSPSVPTLRCLCTESSVKRQFVLNTYHLGPPKIVLAAFRISRLYLSNTERLLKKYLQWWDHFDYISY